MLEHSIMVIVFQKENRKLCIVMLYSCMYGNTKDSNNSQNSVVQCLGDWNTDQIAKMHHIPVKKKVRINRLDFKVADRMETCI